MKLLLCLLTTFLLFTGLTDAQPTAKVFRLGWLISPGVTPNFYSAFLQALQELGYAEGKNIVMAFSAAKRDRAEVLVTINSPLVSSQLKRIVDLAAKSRLPTMHQESRWVEAGGLMSYGTNYADLYRRAATYVDKILKGAKPADLPVEQPKKFDFVINLQAAKQIGVTIPPNVLARADRVIK